MSGKVHTIPMEDSEGNVTLTGKGFEGYVGQECDLRPGTDYQYPEHCQQIPDMFAVENPFWNWSLVEAWQWLVNVPFLGFASLLILGFIAFMLLLVFNALTERHHY